MGWFSSGSSCQGNKEWKCWYEDWETYEQWCKDYDGYCPSVYDRGGLIKQEKTGGGGGGGW